MMWSEALRLGAEELHHLGAEDPLREARIVLHVGGDGELAARLQAREQDRLQIRPRAA